MFDESREDHLDLITTINSFGLNHQTTLHLQSRIAVHFLVILQELGGVLLMAGFRGRLQRGKYLVAAFQNQQTRSIHFSGLLSPHLEIDAI